MRDYEHDPDELDDVYRVGRDGVRHAEPWVSGSYGGVNHDPDGVAKMTFDEFVAYLRAKREQSKS